MGGLIGGLVLAAIAIIIKLLSSLHPNAIYVIRVILLIPIVIALLAFAIAIINGG